MLISVLFSMCLIPASFAGTFFHTNVTKENVQDFFTVTMVKTEQVWFKGTKTLDPILIKSTRGVEDCREICVKNPHCQSFNVGKSKEAEYFCEQTGYWIHDKDYDQENNAEGYDNYSFTERRT